MLAYSGAPVARTFGSAVFDIAGVKVAAKVPILLDHDSTQRAGYADQVEMGPEIRLGGFLSSSTAAGREAAKLSDEGFPWQASIQLIVASWEELEPGASAVVNGREVAGPISIARESRLLESSFLMAGADKDTFAVALAAQEHCMDPKAFAAAHPAAVKEWQDEAATAAKAEERSALSSFLTQFAGREAWAAQRYSEGLSAIEAKAALADILQAELSAAQRAAPDKTEALTLARLAAEVPGVAFDGNSRQGEDDSEATRELLLSALPIEQRARVEWAESPEIRSEFGNRFSAFVTYKRRQAEGLEV